MIVRAHEKAKEFREIQKDEKGKEKPEDEFFMVKNEKNLSKMKKRLDYKNTHFHNPLIQRHDLSAEKENGKTTILISFIEFCY